MTRHDLRRTLIAARDTLLLEIYDMLDLTLARFSRLIPERLYRAVAQVPAYVYRIDRRRHRSW